TSDIYSIVVDIPAFAKYEYKFVNGDQFYEAEFVPELSRVLYNFNDNRWLYVDSIANDTTFVGAIMFGGNAPAGLTLIRFYVDMQNETIAAGGMHVAGNFQGWSTTATHLYNFDAAIWEVIAYVNAGSTYEYKFYNGATALDAETVPAICATNTNRTVDVNYDTLLTVVCYAACTACPGTSAINDVTTANLSLWPNPATQAANISWNGAGSTQIVITDLAGRTVRSYTNLLNNQLTINKADLTNGLYFVTCVQNNNIKKSKLIFN
ncbi:MAG TPA: T9SS type A sorting domain-containing protein, partial [Bacteroidia bacterium]|nr:T9SS type A sorting domain-containing protein [Bacteroidia bacterium]